jgi:hypothetical protein
MSIIANGSVHSIRKSVPGGDFRNSLAVRKTGSGQFKPRRSKVCASASVNVASQDEDNIIRGSWRGYFDSYLKLNL